LHNFLVILIILINGIPMIYFSYSLLLNLMSHYNQGKCWPLSFGSYITPHAVDELMVICQYILVVLSLLCKVISIPVQVGQTDSKSKCTSNIIMRWLRYWWDFQKLYTVITQLTSHDNIAFLFFLTIWKENLILFAQSSLILCSPVIPYLLCVCSLFTIIPWPVATTMSCSILPCNVPFYSAPLYHVNVLFCHVMFHSTM